RPGLNGAGRQQLVAVCPLEGSAMLRNGAQLVSHAAPRDSLGFVTSATPSVVRRGWVGLALLADGRRRMGERLIASSPARDEQTPVEVMSPAWFDPGNSRVHA
ncbi:MAG: sarcosine oxidase subunit alpha, partial [Proteobacteria bacterium]|nr:sarcosine oxidase subunit alpha [Pseudomonadota bacterium]